MENVHGPILCNPHPNERLIGAFPRLIKRERRESARVPERRLSHRGSVMEDPRDWSWGGSPNTDEQEVDCFGKTGDRTVSMTDQPGWSATTRDRGSTGKPPDEAIQVGTVPLSRILTTQNLVFCAGINVALDRSGHVQSMSNAGDATIGTGARRDCRTQ